MNVNRFSVLHEKKFLVSSIDMCRTMDLVAIIFRDGTLSVFRTINWEPVFSLTTDSISSSNEVDLDNKKFAKVARWNISGSLIGVGFEDGHVGVVDVESSSFIFQRRPYHPIDNYRSIVDMSWVTDEPNIGDTNFYSLFLNGGENMIDRIGMIPLPSEPTSSSRQPNWESTAFQKAALLVTLCADNRVHGYVHGIFPLFCVNLSPLETSYYHQLTSASIHGSLKDTLSIKVIERIQIEGSDSFFSCHSISFLSSRKLESFRQLSIILEKMDKGSSKFIDDIKSFSRKWKDATKVIIPKMQLLKGILDGYLMELSPVEFMYSISTCGPWHPGASSSFPNQWNEQGIVRLRSAVDQTLLSIIKYLSMSATPFINNMLLYCKEVILLFSRLGADGVLADLSNDIRELSAIYRVLMRRIEEANEESRITRSKMAMFLQFIREFSIDQAVAQSKPTVPKSKQREIYMELFDLRVQRPPLFGPAGQAEAVTGTYLFRFLDPSEQKAKANSIRNADVCDPITNNMNDIAQIALQSTFGESRGGNCATAKLLDELSLIQLSNKCLDRIAVIRNKLYSLVSNQMKSSMSSLNQEKSAASRVLSSNRYQDMFVPHASNEHIVSTDAQNINNYVWRAYCLDESKHDVIIVATRLFPEHSSSTSMHHAGEGDLIWRLRCNSSFQSCSIKLTSTDNNMNVLVYGMNHSNQAMIMQYVVDFSDGELLSSCDWNMQSMVASKSMIDEELRCRVLPTLSDISSVFVSGSRGIIMCGGRNGLFAFLDLCNDDNDSEVSEEGEDIDEDG